MRRYFKAIVLIIFVLNLSQAKSQMGYVQEGEFGLGLGLGHYIGDLNPNLQVNRPKLAFTGFFRKNINNYIAARIGGSYCRLGYSDRYNSNNELMYRRNLSFNTDVWEASLQFDFNFFYFMPGVYEYSFTPYVTLGAGVFSYDPYAILQKKTYYLRELGTEGQGSALYPQLKPYSTAGFNIPVGMGVKYALTTGINIGFEVLYRITNTDYLDDVSSVYPDPAAFPLNDDGTPSIAQLLSDRSGEVGDPIGTPKKARGIATTNDHYFTAMFHVTFNLQSSRCPKAR